MKEKWAEEEERIMARREAELTNMGTRFINQALYSEFKDRNYEAIKLNYLPVGGWFNKRYNKFMQNNNVQSQ